MFQGDWTFSHDMHKNPTAVSYLSHNRHGNEKSQKIGRKNGVVVWESRVNLEFRDCIDLLHAVWFGFCYNECALLEIKCCERWRHNVLIFRYWRSFWHPCFELLVDICTMNSSYSPDICLSLDGQHHNESFFIRVYEH